MMKNYLAATAAAVVCSSLALGAQAPTPNQAPATTTQNPTTTSQAPSTTAPQSASADKPSATFTGCIYQEKDVPGRAPNVAERVGIGEDYILADVRPAASSGTAGAVGTSGTTAAGGAANRMYKLEFVDGGKLKAMVGKRVEVSGRIDAEAGDSTGQPAARTSATDRVIGRDAIDIAEFEVTSIREVSGTCPASPSAR